MTLEQKKQLIILLNKYKQEILEDDTRMRKTSNKWDYAYNGNKAKLNHCRIIEAQLALEVENELYEL